MFIDHHEEARQEAGIDHRLAESPAAAAARQLGRKRFDQLPAAPDRATNNRHPAFTARGGTGVAPRPQADRFMGLLEIVRRNQRTGPDRTRRTTRETPNRSSSVVLRLPGAGDRGAVGGVRQAGEWASAARHTNGAQLGDGLQAADRRAPQGAPPPQPPSSRRGETAGVLHDVCVYANGRLVQGTQRLPPDPSRPARTTVSVDDGVVRVFHNGRSWVVPLGDPPA